MQSRVSVKGQTVIPSAIRKALRIDAKAVLHWKVRDGEILVYPMPADPVAASLGALKGKGASFDQFLGDRARERRKELAGEGRKR